MPKKLWIAFTPILFGLLLTSAESKGGFSDKQERFCRHATLSSGIVRAQVHVSATHFNQVNATDTVCCCESVAQFKEAHRCTMLQRFFHSMEALCGLATDTWARWGSWNTQTALRQPVCKGMLVPLSFPSIFLSMQGLHLSSDMKYG